MIEHPLLEPFYNLYKELDELTCYGSYQIHNISTSNIVMTFDVTNISFTSVNEMAKTIHKKYKYLIKNVEVEVNNDQIWFTITPYNNGKILKNIRKEKLEKIYGRY